MKIWTIVCAAIFLIVTLINPKVRLIRILKEQLAKKIVVGIIAFLVIKIALNILMILKRVFAIWEK